MTRKNNKNFKFEASKQKSKNIIKPVNSGYHDLNPTFSFKNFIESDKYFSEEHSNEKRNSLYNFFKSLEAFSSYTWGYMKQHPEIFHFHPFENELNVLNEYKDAALDQFKVPGLKHGRFIGFFDNNNIFNILLYDSQHKGDPRK